MKIELKKLKVAEHLSEETTAYSADVYVNGKCIGYAQNNGQGGETDIRCHFPADSSERILCAEAEAWGYRTATLFRGRRTAFTYDVGFLP